MSRLINILSDEHLDLWLEDGIIMGKFRPEVKTLTVELAKKVVNARLSRADGVTRPLLLDMGNVISVDKEARHFFARDENSYKYLSATAIIVRDQIMRMVANVYVMFDSPKIPTKYFSRPGDALKWLAQFRTEKLN